MGRLSQDELKEIDLEFFLDRESASFKLTRGVNGQQLNIKTCPNPACRDDRWRTYYGLDTGMGNCFVCGEGFTAPKFIHWFYDHQNWGETFREIEELLKEQGWQPKRQEVVRVEIDEVKLPAADPVIDENGELMPYLEQRGMSAEIAQYFHLSKSEYGLWIFKNDEGKQQTQRFFDRLIIPVFDLDGKIKTFQGRDLTGKSERKYLFPMSLPGTGRYLLNGHNMMGVRRICMGEGFFDVAAIKMAFDEVSDLRNVGAVGSFGKHLSYGDREGNDQLGRLRSLKQLGLQEVTVMWDGETKALEAALNAAKIIRGVGLVARIALLPFEKDPNEVPAETVVEAFYKAKVWTPKLDIMWRLRSPYSASEREKRAS